MTKIQHSISVAAFVSAYLCAPMNGKLLFISIALFPIAVFYSKIFFEMIEK